MERDDKMISVFIKEQKRYNKNELVRELRLNPDEIITFIRKLKSFGILKMVKDTPEERELSDLADEEIELVNEEEDTDNYFYVFTYVGILTVGKRVLKCYPKYILEEQPKEKMKQVLQVLKKYNSKEQIINLFNGLEESTSFNLLAIMLYLIDDYIVNGAYTNEQMVVESNGMGEILWDNTINETFAIIKSNKPVYTDLKTICVNENEQDYFKRLHTCIVTQCSEVLEYAGLTDLFDLVNVNCSEEKIDDFGDVEHILYQILKELDIQFNDRKKMLLKTMYTYISNRKAFESGFGISMFGTNSFNLVWEDVCAEVFDNQLDKEIENLPQYSEIHRFENNTKTLIEIIEKPKWRYKMSDYVVESQKTLVPDLISIYPYKENYCFSILDAKYYLMRLTKNSISGQPGVGDVTKQYLYQLAYQDLVDELGYHYVQNAFLVPGDLENGEILGKAEFEMMMNAGKDKLEDISIIKLPAQKMYARYISGKGNVELYNILKDAAPRKLLHNTFSYRMMTYFKTGRIVTKPSNKDKKIIKYPVQLGKNVGGKVLFDIIAPEVARHTYLYSPYVREQDGQMVAELNEDKDIEKNIVDFILNIIKDYLDYLKTDKNQIGETVDWTKQYINKQNKLELSDQAVTIAEILWTLYEN